MQTGPGVLLICRIAVVIAWQRLFRGRCANVQNVHNSIDRYFPDLSYEELMKRSPDLVFLVLVESVRSCTAWIGTKWHFAMLFNWALRAPYGLILWLQDHVDNLHELSTFPLLLIQLHDPNKRPWIGHSMSEPQKKNGRWWAEWDWLVPNDFENLYILNPALLFVTVRSKAINYNYCIIANDSLKKLQDHPYQKKHQTSSNSQSLKSPQISSVGTTRRAATLDWVYPPKAPPETPEGETRVHLWNDRN